MPTSESLAIPAINFIDKGSGGVRSRYTTSQLRISYPAGYRLPDDEFGENYEIFAGTIDNIQFTTRIVPEPTAITLAALGMAGWFAAWPRSRRGRPG